MKKYTDYVIEQTCALLRTDSPTGYTDAAADQLIGILSGLGYAPFKTNKGGVAVCLGGGEEGDAILLSAHLDTLGGMVKQIKPDGKLAVVPLNGLRANNCEGENVRIVTKKNGVYEGTFQLINPSTHVNPSYEDTKRTFDACEVSVDEIAPDAESIRNLGIAVGDIVCFEPRTRVTGSGYIKSRFLDDKLSVGVLLGFAKYLRDEKAQLKRRVYAHITVYEEVGHGASAIPKPFHDITDVLAVDMGCIGEGLGCTERQVSICAKDSDGPYSYGMVAALIEAAEKTGADYAVDIYPRYGSDAGATLRGGWDVRHGLIGPGVFASHGYERSHRDGAQNTLKLLIGLLCG